MRVAIRGRAVVGGLAAWATMSFVHVPVCGADAASALAQLKSAQATALKALKLELKSAQGVLLLNLKAFDGTVKAGGFSSSLVTGLFSDLFTFQTATRDAVHAAFAAAADAASDALDTLPDPLNGIYPRGFSPGDGGLADQFRAQVETAVAKSVAQVRKKLAKSTTVAEKAGIGLTFVVRTPFSYTEYRWTETVVSYLLASPPAIDTIIGFSTLAAAGDGHLRLSGHASLIDGETVSVDLTGPTNPVAVDALVFDRRWVHSADVTEGNYSVTVRHDGDTVTFQGAAIGVR